MCVLLSTCGTAMLAGIACIHTVTDSAAQAACKVTELTLVQPNAEASLALRIAELQVPGPHAGCLQVTQLPYM